MSSSAASGSKSDSSKRKAGEAGSTSRDGKKAKVKPQDPATAADEDDEWARFQQEVLSGAAEDTASTSGADSGGSVLPPPTHVYANATIEAQPELRRPATAADGSTPGGAEEEEGEETEAQRRRRLAREEHEEILSRLEDEQRLQDEAEERVSSLKSRLERIKAARAAKPASTPKTKTKLDNSSSSSSSSSKSGTNTKSKGKGSKVAVEREGQGLETGRPQARVKPSTGD